MYFVFIEWEHYGTSGFKKEIFSDKINLIEWLINKYTPKKLIEKVKNGNISIINGEEVMPKIVKKEIIKDIEL